MNVCLALTPKRQVQTGSEPSKKPNSTAERDIGQYNARTGQDLYSESFGNAIEFRGLIATLA